MPARLAWQRRDLQAVLGELLRRGDRPVLRLRCGRRLAGRLVDAGRGWVAVAAPPGRVDVPTSAVVQVSVGQRARSGGRSPSSDLSWRGRLRQLAVWSSQVSATGAGAVEVGDVAGQVTAGRLVVAAADHLYVRGHDGGEVWVAVPAVCWVAITTTGGAGGGV